MSAIASLVEHFTAALVEPPPPAAARVISVVASCFGTTSEAVAGRSKMRHIVRARQVAAYVIAQDFAASSTTVGLWLGRDHSTILHAIRSVRRALDAGDPAITQAIETVRHGQVRRICTAASYAACRASTGGRNCGPPDRAVRINDAGRGGRRVGHESCSGGPDRRGCAAQDAAE